MNYRDFTNDELRWIKKFEKVMAIAPKTLLLFVGSNIAIFSKDEENNRYLIEDGGVDQFAPSVEIYKTEIDFDGGDY